MRSLLQGAEFRASHTRPNLPLCRTWGPATRPEFHTPFLDETGHPTLTIRAWTAVEFAHFDLVDGLAELARALDSDTLDGDEPVSCGEPSESFKTFYRRFSERPAMYIGDATGLTLHAFLRGIVHAGDWLEVPRWPVGEAWLTAIEDASTASYGSPWAAFRCWSLERLVSVWSPDEGDL